MTNGATNILELEHLKFKSLMAGIQEGVILLTPDQKVILANDKACEMTGYSLDEMLGRPAFEVLYLIDSNDQVVDMNQVCPTGGLDMEGVIYKQNSISLVGKTDVVKIVDIQSRKIKEGSKLNLGAMIILNDVFQESELERMKTDFVSMAVHMLRTPLTVIKGFLQSLLRTETIQKLSKSETEDLTSALTGTEELGRLIENLLHMSEIQHGTFQMHTSAVSYDGLVASIVNDFRPVTQSKGLELVYIPPLEDLPRIQIDFLRVREVLRNLLDNAVKFTEAGGVEVRVFKEDGFIHTTIKDTGKGIAYSNLDYIFTKFYRIKDPLAMAQGLGMGLFISKQIIEAHKGKIWSESIEGQGSIFHFTLPISLQA